MRIIKEIKIFAALAFTFFSMPAMAGIQAELDRALVDAARPHTNLSNKEIMFERRCEMIEKYLGYDGTALSQAMKYSCQGTQIGVALRVGADLGKYPPERIRDVYIERFRKEGLNAEVFIQEELEHGSNVVFFVNGESWLKELVGPIQALEKSTS